MVKDDRRPPVPTQEQFFDRVTQLLKSGRCRAADAAIEKDALATARLLVQEGQRAAALIAHLLDILLALRQPAGQPNTTPAWSSKAYDARDRDDLIGEILFDKGWDPLARNMPKLVEREFAQRHPDIPIDDRTVAYVLKAFGFIRLYWVREEILRETGLDLKAPGTRERLGAEIRKRHPEIEPRIISMVLTRLERGDEDAPTEG
jgi:hypothetical protein